jgi:hypothetical protein
MRADARLDGGTHVPSPQTSADSGRYALQNANPTSATVTPMNHGRYGSRATADAPIAPTPISENATGPIQHADATIAAPKFLEF